MNFSFLAKTSLFRGASEYEVQSMLQCLGASVKQFTKNDIIYHTGDTIDALGMVISGSVNIEINDVFGNRNILAHIEPGQIFAETYASVSNEQLLVDVVAAEHCKVLFLNIKKLLQTCPNACAHHSRLIQNLLQLTAQKNLNLSRRIVHTAPKTIRERLLSYFSEQILQQNSYHFTIPFNRQQLADYLNVDRSALSNELSKMQKDGILTYERNSFHLKQP